MNERVAQTIGAALAAAVLAALVTAGVMWLVLGGGGPPDGAGGPPGGGPPGGMGGPPPATVIVAEAEAATLRQRLAVPGRLQEVRRATVASQVTGSVVEVPVNEGDRVVANETVLARVDPVWTQLELAQAEADLQEEQANLEQAQRELARVTRLREQSAATQEEVDDRKTAVDAAQARVDALQATRDRARESVARLAVVAPFDGYVTHKTVEVGQWVTPGAAVVDLISSGEIDAVVDVPEAAVNRMTVGNEVEVYVDALGRSVTGRVASITPAGPSAARTYPVKVRLGDMGGQLKAGMSVTARLPLGAEAEQLTVPRDAVRLIAGGDGTGTVWAGVKPEAGAGGPPGAVRDRDGPTLEAAAMRVRVLFGDGSRLAVEPLPSFGGKRLEPGMRVVVQGAEGLFPGRPLILSTQTAAAPGDPPADEVDVEVASDGEAAATQPTPDAASTPDDAESAAS